jgi:hypothetical protein
MARIAKHIQIARANGAEAGLRALVQYLNSPLGKANEHVVETRATLQACGNFDNAIAKYEELFLADAPVIEASEPSDWLTAIVDAPAPTKKRTRKSSKTAGPITKLANEKPRTWNAFWVERNGIPTKVGAEFVYTSKKYRTTSKHRVESVLKDGSVVTRRISLTRKGR